MIRARLFQLLCIIALGGWQLRSGELIDTYGRLRQELTSGDLSEEEVRIRFRALHDDVLSCAGAQFTAIPRPVEEPDQQTAGIARDALLASLVYAVFGGDVYPRYSCYHLLSEDEREQARNALRHRLSLILAVYPICRTRSQDEELWLITVLSPIYAVMPGDVAEAVSKKAESTPTDRRLPLDAVVAFHSGEDLERAEPDRQTAEACLSALRTHQRMLNDLMEKGVDDPTEGR